MSSTDAWSPTHKARFLAVNIKLTNGEAIFYLTLSLYRCCRCSGNAITRIKVSMEFGSSTATLSSKINVGFGLYVSLARPYAISLYPPLASNAHSLCSVSHPKFRFPTAYFLFKHSSDREPSARSVSPTPTDGGRPIGCVFNVARRKRGAREGKNIHV